MPGRSRIPPGALVAALIAVLWIAIVALGGSEENTVSPAMTEAEVAAQIEAPDLAQAPAEEPGETDRVGEPDREAVRELTPSDLTPYVEEAPVRIRLVDEDTLEPVPFYPVTLFCGSDLGGLVSDASGLIDTSAPFGLSLPLGEASLRLEEEWHPDDLIQKRRKEAEAMGRVVEFEHLGGARSQDVPVPVGPTYRLALVQAPHRSRLEASLRAADPRVAFDRVYARPHPKLGPDLTLRFSPLARLLSGGPPWRLELGAIDGLWHGSAWVDSVIGVHPTVVEIVFEQRARLHGKILRPDGEPLARNWVQLWGLGASFDDPDNRPIFRLTSEEGVFEHRWVPPGTYTLKVELEGARTHEQTLVLAAGEDRGLDVALEPAGEIELGRVRGVVRSRTGAFHGDMRVVMVLLPTRRLDSAAVQWTETAGVWEGRFVLEGVDEHEKELRVRTGELYPVVPGVRLVTATRDDSVVHEFLVEDEGTRTPLVFRGLDAESGEPLLDFQIALDVDPSTPRAAEGFRTGKQGLARFESILEPGRWSFRAYSEGYQPIWGDQDDFAGARERTLRMTRGWGAEVRVVDRERRPLEGAGVTFDGHLVGRTDATGELRVCLPGVPSTGGLEYQGWRIVSPTDIYADTGTLRPTRGWLNVTLAPPE